MLQSILELKSGLDRGSALFVLTFSILAYPSAGLAQIVWSGDYDTGNFLQWHSKSDNQHPQFAGIPAYGRPVAPEPFTGSADRSYYGDGSLLELVTNPVRNGTHAAKFTVKNSANGVETRDCDNGNCTRRRTELNMHLTMLPVYGEIQTSTERWISISHYLPADWDSSSDRSWGPTVFQLKSPATNEISPTLAISIGPAGWGINHRWAEAENPNSFDVLPWQYQMSYGSDYPTNSDWPDGLADFPDVQASKAALADLNKGGWTDWVMHVKFDGRGSRQGGSGFITIWKRAGSGPWVKVLHITPKETTRGGMTFDHGIGYKVPGSGFGPLAGMYMGKAEVWDLPKNRVLYNDNIKIGDSTATFADMSPDGSTPDDDQVALQESRPKPPAWN